MDNVDDDLSKNNSNSNKRKPLYHKKNSLSENKIEDFKKFTFKHNSNIVNKNENLRNRNLINKDHRNSVKSLNSKLIENNPDKKRNNLEDKLSSTNNNNTNIIKRRSIGIETTPKKIYNYSSAVQSKGEYSPKSNYSDNAKKKRNLYIDLNTNISIKSNPLDSCKSKYSKNLKLQSKNVEKDLKNNNNNNYNKFTSNSISKNTNFNRRISAKNLQEIKNENFINAKKFLEIKKSPKYLNNSIKHNKKIINNNILKSDYNVKNRVRSLDEKPKQELKEKIKNFKNEIEIKMNVNKFSFNEFYDKGVNNYEDYNNNSKENFSYLNITPSLPNNFNLNDNPIHSEYSIKKSIAAANEDLIIPNNHKKYNQVFTLEDEKFCLKDKIRKENTSKTNNRNESLNKNKENKNKLFNKKINYKEAIDRIPNQDKVNNEKNSAAKKPNVILNLSVVII